MNRTFLVPATALLSLLVLLAPMAAALSADVPVAAPLPAESDISCGDILTEGVVPWTFCLVDAGIAVVLAVPCIAWAIGFGQNSPCPF